MFQTTIVCITEFRYFIVHSSCYSHSDVVRTFIMVQAKVMHECSLLNVSSCVAEKRSPH